MKQRTPFETVGWIVAAALGTAFLLGFQTPADKAGYVDVNTLVQNSDQIKANDTVLQKYYDERANLLNFVTQNPAIGTDRLPKLKELWLTQNPTAAQTAELERIKTDALADTKRATDYAAKDKRTPDEQAALDDYVRRKQYLEQNVLPAWTQEFEAKLQGIRTDFNTALTKKAREAVAGVARAQGYTIVFASPSALYGANDLTAESTKALNAAK